MVLKRFCVGVCLLGLAGCGNSTTANFLPFDGLSNLTAAVTKPAVTKTADSKPAARRDRSNEALLKTRLAAGGITVRGPKGYCIDKKSTRRNTALLVSCAAFSDKAPDVPAQIGALRLTVGKSAPTTSIDLGQMADLLGSETGREALSRSGDPATVSVQSTIAESDAVYLRVQDTSPSPFGANNGTEWRAITKLNGQFSVASVSGYGDLEIGEADGLELLKGFVAGLIAENPSTVSKKETKNPLNALLKRVKG